MEWENEEIIGIVAISLLILVGNSYLYQHQPLIFFLLLVCGLVMLHFLWTE
jgi:hypothetical protein